ncbi:MAG: hypothetical protein V1750_08085 [Acidobacteriota bacterium]
MARRKRESGLIVVADGVQAAFAAGAVAELARGGAVWVAGLGAGLGAQLAVLALLDEAAEGERRWRRQAEMGCALLVSKVALARESAGASAGVLVLPDALALAGWLDSGVLAEHLAPELGGVPRRLKAAGARCWVAVEDLTAGVSGWHELGKASASEAGGLLCATAAFPAGWGPFAGAAGDGERLMWGGAGALREPPEEALAEAGRWDVVCGFPVPAVARPALSRSLLELVQRREEAAAAAEVARWLAGPLAGHARLYAPAAETYLAWGGRDSADLGVEYPLAWERNGELAGMLIDFGGACARRAASSI